MKDEPKHPAIIETIIEYIITEIWEGAVNVSRDKRDITVLPWDAQQGIAYDEDLSQLFKIHKGMNCLPVTVTVRGQDFNYAYTEEYMIGLLLFIAVSKSDFTLTMFETLFTPDYIIPPPETGEETEDDIIYHERDSRFHFGNKQQPLSVIVGTQRYGFFTPQFLQGITIGAVWAGLHARNYWKNLTQYTYQLDGTMTAISLTG